MVLTYKYSNLCITGKDRFMAVKASYIASGLTTRIHGNSFHRPKHALKFDEITNLITFLRNYAEKHAILLPGRIPGYKRDDIQLLPSCTTKKVMYTLLALTLNYYLHTVGCVDRVQIILG